MKKQKIAAILHTIIMILSYTSPLWLDWKIMVIGVVLYYIQLKIFGGCILTYAQFGKWNASFTGYYLDRLLQKFDIQISPKKIKLFLDLLAPIFLIIAIISQVVFKFKPFISVSFK